MFLTLDGRGQQLPGVFRGYPLILPKSGTQKLHLQTCDMINVKAETLKYIIFVITGSGKSKKPGKAAAKYGKDTLAEV